MSDTAIRVEHLSKQYNIDVVRRHDTLRDQLADGLTRLLPHRRHSRGTARAEIWALQDVSLEVNRGEVLGLVGRNGAGKSTLLKILSRITKPTEGRAEIHGRVGSLLEVGTGFHQELTGRENIYLNGAILGMKKREIDRRFDEIVAFAEVEKFIDTPVKRYSSGMYVRLAFAVAAHLEAEILLVDEVLAVGDAAFQEKCMGTMRRSASSGKTVVIVSHNMASIQHLCGRAVLLSSGRVSGDGPPQEVVRMYLSECTSSQARPSVSLRNWTNRVTNGRARIVRLDVTDGSGRPTCDIPIGGTVRFSIVAEFYESLVDPCFGVLIHDADGKPLLDLRSIHSGLRLGRVKGTSTVHACVQDLGLYPGEYLLSPWVADGGIDADWVQFGARLYVYPAPGYHGDLRLDPSFGRYWVPSLWTTNGESDAS